MPASSMARAAISPISSVRSQRIVPSGPATGRRREAPDEPPRERAGLHGHLVGLGPGDPAPLLRAAVLVAGDHVLGDVDETARQVPRVGGAERGVGEALAGAVGGDEVLEDGHPLAEVAPHGDVDDPARRVGHEAAHRAQLADVALVAAGTRGGHHRDRAVRVEVLHHLVRQVLRGLLPDVDDRLVALVVGDEAALELAVDLRDLVVRRRRASPASRAARRCRRRRSSCRRGSRTRSPPA